MANNEASVEQEVERQLNPIACSHCRQRKRKCDRQLPHCLQCTNDPTNCHYPEQNKRGLPIGFITRLEARLAETEEALFRLVHSIDEPNNNHISLKPSSQRKDDRIREWDSLPLRNVDEIRSWYRSRSEQTHSPTQHDALMDENQRARSINATPPDPEPTDFPDDAGDDGGETITLQDADDDVMPGNDIHIQEESSGSKAKEMEQKHPNMYF
ncbi:hypothetical protein H9Q69_007276 [Fusarium xylarioides]|uniref:Uncharacterized protein n=1 Tax=Fusarium xylarioides TaxID=221167 RepID=A0A9P7LHB3_9HYPO|nr:hypothetical protein H9Q70_000418 [Fusarium xylarioides]KAG5766330.1 hypothetical protein H9Q72_005633 [Fusarium xylarioides]KAG5793677.1 hypothetical protein H9Q69_007276 [Fusarium xylarioides]KAG5806512.1 hypothetical protein H9Q71_008910 [Fusarium xylarioides]KAG5826728.1 hypothetical protein H9Q74_003181 [Fusarium xylarioides]